MLLARVLASLQSATRPSNWEVRILVVANACTDSTHQLLDNEHQNGEEDRARLPLDWLPEPRPGKSFALNTAIPLVKASDVVTFVDDDHRVDANYLFEICRAAEDYPEATMFSGRILPDWDGSEPAWVHDEGPYKIRPLPIPRSDSGPKARELTLDDPPPGGGNLFLRGDLFNRVGSFSTELGPRGHDLGGGEDSVFVQSALNLGERLMYVPTVLQYHYVDTERLRFGYVLRKAFHRSRSVIASRDIKSGLPIWMWRKLGASLLNVFLPLGWARSRYYLVRVATTLGEMTGQRQAQQRRNTDTLGVKRDRRYLMGIFTAITMGMFAGFAHDPRSALTILMSICLASAIGSFLVGMKSLKNFTQTGPKLQAEILSHYRRYSFFAFMRLLGIAFILLAWLAAPGALIYGSVHTLDGSRPDMLGSVLAGIASILLLAALQFSRHLLWQPANIAASYIYRLSRLYPIWRCLSPWRLRVSTLAILGLPSAYLLAAVPMLVAMGAPFAAFALTGSILGYTLLGLWLRDKPINMESPPQRDDGPPNIIMIGSDTLRSDRLDGSYGRNVAPYLRSLVNKGVLFSHCYVPCARTAPSLLAMLTGHWPHRFGVRDNYVTDEETQLKVDTLPHILHRHGYYTAALSDWCGADMGKFTLGFDYVDVPEDQWNIKMFIRQGPKDLRLLLSLFARNRLGKRFLPEIYYLGGVPLNDELGRDTKQLIHQLAGQAQPFFLNIFLSTTHGPFGSEYPYYTRYADPAYSGESKFVMARLTDPFEIIRRQGEPREEFDLDQIINLYDGCVARLDDEVKGIVEHLEHCGLANNTILVVYSDHGMEFFEHGTWGQGNSVVGEVSNRIPLLIHAPGIQADRIITDPVRSIDLMPTLLELAGIAVPANIDGVSLAPQLHDPAARPIQDVFSETGIWLTNLPGTPDGHLRYPNLLEMLTVQNKETGTISIKPEYATSIISAKDRMIRSGRWKLVYQPLETRALLKLYDLNDDPGCEVDVINHYPEIVRELFPRLVGWINSDPALSSIGGMWHN
jgi:arylsulfatase A-like enzyme/GT2 family glycosyltransferase